MRYIPYHIMLMSIYALIALPIILLARQIYRKKTGTRIIQPRETILVLFFVYLTALLACTVLPYVQLNASGWHFITKVHESGVRPIPFAVFSHIVTDIRGGNGWRGFWINFIGNIFVFVPYGFLLPYLWRCSTGKTVLYGALLSLTIEILQLFLPRITDIDDLLLNTLGAFLGAWLFILWKKHKGDVPHGKKTV